MLTHCCKYAIIIQNKESGDCVSREICPNCKKELQFYELEPEITSLLCPNCHNIIFNYTHVSVKTRIEQGYSRYSTYNDSLAEWYRENESNID